MSLAKWAKNWMLVVVGGGGSKDLDNWCQWLSGMMRFGIVALHHVLLFMPI